MIIKRCESLVMLGDKKLPERRDLVSMDKFNDP